MHNGPSKAHLRSRLRCSVQWVVITIQSIQMGCLLCRLKFKACIRLLALWWIIVGCLVALWSPPSALSREESTAHHPGVYISILRIYDCLLCLDDSARLAFVIDAEHFTAKLKLATFGARGQSFVELNQALTIYDTAGVELWDAWDGNGIGACIEVDNILVRALEGKNDAVGWEDLEVGVKFLSGQAMISRRNFVESIASLT